MRKRWIRMRMLGIVRYVELQRMLFRQANDNAAPIVKDFDGVHVFSSDLYAPGAETLFAVSFPFDHKRRLGCSAAR
jgi:hypothetical protein